MGISDLSFKVFTQSLLYLSTTPLISIGTHVDKGRTSTSRLPVHAFDFRSDMK